MNIHRIISRVSALVLLPSSLCQGQGSLTPPAGPPAPVMKTLDQIESRTPVNKLSGDATAAHIITLPGSYYLTGPVIASSGKSGIRIEATNVTLDLNGFSLEGVAGSREGIRLTAAGGHVAIRNGMLRFWPQGGILSAFPNTCSLEDITISSVSGPGISIPGSCTVNRVSVNGAKGDGIKVKGGTVTGCVVENVAAPTLAGPAAGISAENGTVLSSMAKGIINTGTSPATGIRTGIARDCSVENVSTGDAHASGIFAVVLDGNGSIAQTGSAENCRVRGITSAGLSSGLYYFGTVRGCTVQTVAASGGAGPTGIVARVVRDSTVIDVDGVEGWSTGISASTVIDSMVDSVQSSGQGKCVGISLSDASGPINSGVARGCQVRDVKTYGIYTFGGAAVSGCSVTGQPGLPAGKTAFYSYAGANVFEGNSASYCATGFQSNAPSSDLFVRNLSKSNSADFAPGTGAVATTSVSSATNPFSNFIAP